ncbi:MAG: NAD-dependent epimerase/dehydratase family protein [Acidobacteriota bacterium]
MKILIIGGTKFIGLAALRALHADGHELAVLNRGKTEAELPEGVRRIVGNRDDMPAAREAIVDFGPEVVLHNVVSELAQVEGWIESCRDVARRLVMTSSCDVYAPFGRLHGTEEGEPIEGLLDEDGPLRSVMHPYRAFIDDEDDPRWRYDKIPCERAVLSADGFEGVVLRLPMVLGPGDPQHRLHGWIRPMLDERPGIVLDEGLARWRSTYGFVEDCGRALATACTHEAAVGRTYNVGEHVLSTRELVEEVAAVLGWSGDVVERAAEELPEDLRAGFGVEHSLTIDARRLREELGCMSPFSLRQVIEKTVAWERDNPPEPLPEPKYELEDEVLAG